MKPIKIIFAAAWAGGGAGETNVFAEGVRNKLVSYAYPSQFKGWYDCLKQDPTAQGTLFLDSGAFSAWNKGKEIDIHEYITYAASIIDAMRSIPNYTTHVVNLDVIPGKAGQTSQLNKNRKEENLSLIEEAARRGFRNMRIMIREGITPIHVFHQGEDFRWLDRMLEHVPYIGVSPANDLPSQQRNAWMRTVFEYLYKTGAEVDTHGFAVTNHRILYELPWTSCDSASWRLAAGMGSIYLPVGGYSDPDYSQGPLVLNVSERKNAVGQDNMSSKKLEWYLQETGYTLEALQEWTNRTRINIRFFLGLEKWLNEQKAKTPYQPNQGLGLF